MKGLNSRLLSVLEGSDLPLFVVDTRSQCILVSAGMCSLLGCDAAPAAVLEFWPEFQGTAPAFWTGAAGFMRADSTNVPVNLASYPLGDAVLYIALGQSPDGGERSVGQSQIRSERMETLGMLAGGVAHDFNNVLTGILGHVTYLKTVLPRTGGHVESISAIEEGARKASSMTQQILNFSKANPEEKPSAIDLGSVVRSTVKLLRGAMPTSCFLDCSIPDSALRILAVEGRISQILINLVVNARDAVATDGKIRVVLDTTDDQAELDEVFGGTDLSSVLYARLVVLDNGHGMTDEVRRRMFEPYFSTKKALGTGLGLATVHQTVKQFGGAISVDSEPGTGTRIAVYLPLLHASREEAKPSGGQEVELRRGRERILIVDDEYPVRNVLCVSLEHLGYDVDAASSGAEALEKYEESKSPYDLVILDMIMPNLSGDRVFAKLKVLDPAVRVLVISGYSSEAAVQSILDSGGLDFMPKPFTIEELSRKVRDCIEGKT